MIEKNTICDAQECDWLNVSYAEKYAEKPKRKKIKKPLLIVFICVVALVALLLLDNGFDGKVFTTAKETFLSVMDVFDSSQEQTTGNIELPINVSLVEVKDGVATFSAGKVLLSFTNGEVAEVGEDSLTISIDDETQIVYQGLGDIFVEKGAKVKSGELLSRADETIGVTIVFKNEVVQNVISSNYQLKWSV